MSALDDLELERNALVLSPGDIIVVRNRNRILDQAMAEMVREHFLKYGIQAIVVGSDWEIVRDQAPNVVRPEGE